MIESTTRSRELPRLSGKEVMILELLSESGEGVCGFDLVKISDGQLERTTIYVMLHRMEGRGLVESELEARPAPEVGRPRRKYKVSDYGGRVAAAYRAAYSVMAESGPREESTPGVER